MSKKIRTEAVDYLFKAILSLQDKEECYIFFEDICTINELLSLSQRFEVAKNAERAEDISGDCRQDRCIDCNDQPRKSIAELWQ